MTQTPILGELKYEIDSLYVSADMILSRRFREVPLDGLLLEACLLHFRVVWDFFYRPKKERTDVVVRDYAPAWRDIAPPARLRDIRKWLNVMLAHLTTHRVTVPAMDTGVVGRGERADHELPRLHGFDGAADFFDEAAVFMPHRRRTVDRLH